MQAQQSMSRAYVATVTNHPDLQHAAVRIGLWLVSAAEQQGGFPVELHSSAFFKGFDNGKVHVPGVNFRPATIRNSLASLVDAGMLHIEDGTARAGGYTARKYTLLLDA